MRYGRKARGPRGGGQWPHPLRRISYDKLAEDQVFEMAECVHSQDACELCAPFESVIIDPYGAVVFQYEIGEDWQVRHNDPK